MTTKFKATEIQPRATRFPLTDERAERIVMLAKAHRAAYISGLFAAARASLAGYTRGIRAIAPTSMIRRLPQA